MSSFIASGAVADLVLLVMAVEFIALTALQRTGRMRRAVDLLSALVPGACLVLALRAALTGAAWPWIAGMIALSFPFHVIDVVRRS